MNLYNNTEICVDKKEYIISTIFLDRRNLNKDI